MHIYKLLIYNFIGTIYLHRIFEIFFLFYRFVINFESVQVGTDKIY